MKRGTSRYVDVLLLIVEPYYRSLEAGARFYRLGKELGIKKIVAVANKVKNKEDEEAINQFCQQIDLPVEAMIPLDPNLAEADKNGSLVLDDIENSPALKAISQLAKKLLASHQFKFYYKA